MARCGAKTRSGQPCQSQAMTNGRCRMHGGSSPGAPAGNKRSAKPGSIYSKFLTPEETALLPSIELGSVDDELRLTRIRLMRALATEHERADTLEVYEEVERTGGGEYSPGDEQKRRTRDYAGLIDRLTARIESLEARRSILQQQQLDAELKRLDAEKLRLELRDKGAGKDDAPVGKIVIEVVGSPNARNPDDHDGAAGGVLPAS